MKRLLILCLIFWGTNSYAQNWTFTLSGTSTNITNTAQIKNIFNSDNIYLDFQFLNITTDTLGAILSRKIIQAPSGGVTWNEIASYGNASAGISIDLSSVGPDYTCFFSLPMPPNEVALTSIILTPEPAEAPAIFRYYFGVVGDLYQDSVDIIVQSTLNLNELEKDFELSLSPNPANEKINIQASNIESGNMKIIDVFGNVVSNSNFTGLKTIDTANYRNGIYFVMITSPGNKTINRKLVVRH